MTRTCRTALASLLVTFVVAACTADDPQIGGGGGGDGTDAGGVTPGTDGGGGGEDGGLPCASSCDGDTLRTCKPDGAPVDVACADGCAAGPPAHCKAFVPSPNGITAADLDGAGLQTVAVIANGDIDTDTGAITNVRPANADPNVREVKNGIAFHVVDVPGGDGKIGIFSFESFTVGDGVNLVGVGTNALGLAAAKEITVLGVLDGRGKCVANGAGPGGGVGGSVAGLAQGAGKGAIGASNGSGAISGGGGGGFGDDGGSSFAVGVGQTIAGGLPYGDLTLVPLRGGSGGGRGGDGNTTTKTAGGGGGGGGALHLAAGSKITIGGGSAPGGINAGGCGGAGAANPNLNLAGGGGGGGSGGAILVEAPTVKLDNMGHLVANGGAGGGGAQGANQVAMAGQPGKLTYSQTGFHGSTRAPTSDTGCGDGGFGGASIAPASTPPSTIKGQAGQTGGTGNCAGGGGGGAGRVRVNTKTGAMIVVNASGIVSPRFEDMNSHADPVSSQGTVTLQ